VLQATWEASQLPAAYDVIPVRCKVEDSCRVIGEAIRGWTHDEFRVEGAAAFLRTDQASEYLSDELALRTRFVGMGPNPGESYSPGGDGVAESLFGLLDAKIKMIPGTTQWVKDRTGISLPTGEISWEALLEAVDAAFHEIRFVDRFTEGEWEGWTRFEKHRELVQTGELCPEPVKDEDLARLAVPEAENTYDLKKGLSFRGTRYLSNALSDNARKGKMTICTLIDETEIFVFDRDGQFLGTAWPRHLQDDGDKAAIHAARAMRASIRTNILKQIAADKRAEGAATVRDQASRNAVAPTSSEAPDDLPEAPASAVPQQRGKRAGRSVKPLPSAREVADAFEHGLSGDRNDTGAGEPA
jgi:hypothetical protein